MLFQFYHRERVQEKSPHYPTLSQLFGETPLMGIYLEYELVRQRSPEPRLSEKRDLSAARFQEHL